MVKANSMSETVHEIISRIPGGRYFDSHYIIDTLILRHTNVYLNFAREFDLDVGLFHAEIGNVISSHTDLLDQIKDAKFYGYNIHGVASECTLWKRK